VENLLFVKRFTHDESAEYPDYGVNTEVYTEGRFQELELLGPHRVVCTGESLVLTEEWNLFPDVEVATPRKSRPPRRSYRPQNPLANELGLNLYSSDTGGCSDGLHIDRVNQNEGAESTLSFLLSLSEIQLAQNVMTAFRMPIEGQG
jgi:hypothetical protein